MRSAYFGVWWSGLGFLLTTHSNFFSPTFVKRRITSIFVFFEYFFCCELARWNKILDKRRTEISILKQESEISQETEIRQDRENKFVAKHFCFVSSSDLMAEARQTKWRTICEIINKKITYLVSFSQKSRTICLRSKSFENMRSQQYLCNQWLFSNSN